MTKNALMPVFLSAAKALGLFAVARRLTRKHLRIIAYHGGNFVDENTFRGGLFITTETFKKRIDYLKRVGYPVLPLAEAIELLQAGKLPDNSTVITIDDGWYSCLRELAPILKENNFCSTLYMSSYYMNYPFPVFNVAVDYAIWKSKVDELNLSVLDEQQTGFVSFRTPADRMDAHSKLLEMSGLLETAEQRNELLTRFCIALELDPVELFNDRKLSFMTPAEVYKLRDYDIDVQLHTHRHNLPNESFEQMENELHNNRIALRNLHSSPLEHFCYPSGEYNQEQVQWIANLDIKTATTVESGLNRTTDLKLHELDRFLDSDGISQTEFEAEMSGFCELYRWFGFKPNSA